MKYRIEISSVAESEADKAFLRLSQITSPSKASQWYAQLLQAIDRTFEGLRPLPLEVDPISVGV